MNTIDRFLSKVNKTESCWVWESDINMSGYGYFQVKVNGKQKKVLAHRYSWMINNGEIPKDICICHTCDNRLCVNPLHMFLGTRADNRRDCVLKNRQAKGENCGQSKLTEENVKFIRSMDSVLKNKDLAKQFNVSESTIERVLSKETWHHVK